MIRPAERGGSHHHDPHASKRRRHSRHDILAIAFYTIPCGAQTGTNTRRNFSVTPNGSPRRSYLKPETASSARYSQHKLAIWVIMGLSLYGRYPHGTPTRLSPRCPRPECGSNWMPKDGTSKGRQVCHCGNCGRRTIPDAAYQRPGAADKERALAMSQEGSSLSTIAPDFRGQRPGGQPVD